jgi:hypothetical protein
MTASTEPSRAQTVSRQRIPDFFVLGHHKCGTTALYAMLGRHPQIYLPRLKEPRFLASDLRYPNPPGRAIVPETLEQYLALFDGAGPDQRAGEGSPMYLWSREAARNIAEIQPDARMIAILREPVSFLSSLHNHLLLHHVETEGDLRRALALEPDRRRGQGGIRECYWPQALLYSDHLAYVEQLRRYHAQFPKEQLLVLIYEDFRRENEATVRRVLRFLEVDDTVPVEVMERMPTTTRVRARRLDSVIRSLYAADRPWSRVARASLGALTTDNARKQASRMLRRRVVYAKPQGPDERLTLELRRRFKPEVEALSSYLDRDLVAEWGYDQLG